MSSKMIDAGPFILRPKINGNCNSPTSVRTGVSEGTSREPSHRPFQRSGQGELTLHTSTVLVPYDFVLPNAVTHTPTGAMLWTSMGTVVFMAKVFALAWLVFGGRPCKSIQVCEKTCPETAVIFRPPKNERTRWAPTTYWNHVENLHRNCGFPGRGFGSSVTCVWGSGL